MATPRVQAQESEPTGIRSVVTGEIRALMGRHQTTQVELAEVTGMSQPALSRRLAGRQAFDVDELEAIARFYDLPITELLIRSRCFSLVENPNEQMQLDLDHRVADLRVA